MKTALYIHVPFCRSKCRYCSFTSFPCPGGTLVDDYLSALMKQIEVVSEHWLDGRYETMFIGGGTPTIYHGSALAKIINACLAKFPFAPGPEITVETNPNTVSLDSLKCLVDAGVNRLSIGVQSFDDGLLKVLGRTHSVREAFWAFELARQAGFKNINLDLMFGLPGQSKDDWGDTLAKAVDLSAEHLAVYELTIEEGTEFERLFRKEQLQIPDDEIIADMGQMTNVFLAEHGFEKYEISNFSKKGRNCQHNINYWENGSYLGLGAGSVSNLAGLRIVNIDDPLQYVKLVDEGELPIREGEALSVEASFRESVIMGMRMTSGVNIAKLHERYGLDPMEYYGDILQDFIDRGLVNIDTCLKLTDEAMPVANQVLSELV